MKRKRRGYLKHYNDATVGKTIQGYIIDQRYDAVVLFWYLLELQNQNEGQKTEISIKVLRRNLNVRLDRLTMLVSYMHHGTPELNLNYTQTKLEFFYSKYTEYQDSRSTNNPRKSHESAHILDNRLKIIDNRSILGGEGGRKKSHEVNETLHVTKQTEAHQFFDFFNGEIDDLQKSYPSLQVRQEIKKVLYFYQRSDFLEMPKTRSHWINAIKKKLQTRDDEIKALADRGLKEVWDESYAKVEYHRV